MHRQHQHKQGFYIRVGGSGTVFEHVPQALYQGFFPWDAPTEWLQRDAEAFLAAREAAGDVPPEGFVLVSNSNCGGTVARSDPVPQAVADDLADRLSHISVECFEDFCAAALQVFQSGPKYSQLHISAQ